MRRFALFLTVAFQFASFAWSQPTIVLRDFTLPNSPVTGFDEDGVRLHDGTIISWDMIAQATVEPADQARADQLLETIGQPLFQMRWRLEIGDFAGAQQAAASVRGTLQNRRSPAALVLYLTDMASEIEQGDLIIAAMNWVRAVDLLQENPKWGHQLPDKLSLPADPASTLHPKIFPVWDAADKAKELWPQVERFAADQKFEMLPPTAQVYLIAIAIDARQFEKAKQWIKRVHEKSSAWSAALSQRLQRKSGQQPNDGKPFSIGTTDWPDDVKAVATYWQASEKLASSVIPTTDLAAVDMLSIPAHYQRQFPELAAAALAAVAQQQRGLGDEVSAERLYKEIQLNYSETNVARRLTLGDQRPNEQPNESLRSPIK